MCNVLSLRGKNAGNIKCLFALERYIENFLYNSWSDRKMCVLLLMAQTQSVVQRVNQSTAVRADEYLRVSLKCTQIKKTKVIGHY